MIFLVLLGKIIFIFAENMILFFRQKRNDDLCQKIHANTMFLQMFWKDDFSKKIALGYGIFCNTCKDSISFFPKIWYFFFKRKLKDDLFQKIHANVILSLCMYKHYKYITLLPKKSKIAFSWKNTLKGDVSGIIRKYDIYPRKYGISVEISYR